MARGGLLVRFEIPSLAADVAARESALAQANARVATHSPRAIGSPGCRSAAWRRDARSTTPSATSPRRGRPWRKTTRASRPRGNCSRARKSWRRSTAWSCAAGTTPATWWMPATRIPSFALPTRRVSKPRGLVPASDVARVAAGQPAEVKGPGDVEWPATAIATPAAVDATTSSARVRLALRPSSLVPRPSSSLPPIGLPIEAAITVMSRDAAVAVPASAPSATPTATRSSSCPARRRRAAK